MSKSLYDIVQEWLDENDIDCRKCTHEALHRCESPCRECIVNTDVIFYFEPIPIIEPVKE